MLSADRLRGMMVGLAVGDALGAPVEFMHRSSFQPVTGYRAGGVHALQPGEWTDDTSMALALADSIANVGWDLNDQARRYLAWYRLGDYSVVGRCFDIGSTTRRSLERFERTGDARSCADRSADASGNGSIMRLAPVAIHHAHLFPERLEELVERAAESSLTTHGSEQCLSACRYLALLLAGLAHGVSREEVLDPSWEPLGRLHEIQPLHPAVEAVASGEYHDKTAEQIRGSGYVVESLEAALWSFRSAADFREAVLRAVNLGADADTTGAVCGQLAGACWGESGIPEEWRSTLARWDLIDGALNALLGASLRPTE
jgi:ADP-ribosylglycohydrolase